MDIEKLFSINPNFGASTPEPNLWTIVFKYYVEYFPADKANKLADDYMNAIIEEFNQISNDKEE